RHQPEKVVASKIEPPHRPPELEDSASEKEFNFDPCDTMLIAAAYETHMSRINQRFRDIQNATWLLDDEDYCLAVLKVNELRLEHTLACTTYSLFITKRRNMLRDIIRNL
ncbi:hypothetical protein TSMEX_002826, partial [Taenia solium]